MKKLVSFLLVVMFISSVTLLTCLTAGTALAAPKYPLPEWPKSLVLAAPGGQSSTQFAVYAGYAKMIQNKLGISCSITSTAGVETSYMYARGEIDSAWTSSGGYGDRDSLYGINLYKKAGPAPIRTLAGYYLVEWEMVALNSSGINTYQDLKGKAVMTGIRGGGAMMDMFKAKLKVYGVPFSDIKATTTFSAGREQYDAIKSGAVDAIQMGSVYPNAGLLEMAKSHPWHFLGHSPENMAKIQEILPWIVAKKIPAGAYDGMVKEDTLVTAYPFYITVRKTLPDSLAHAMVRLIFDDFKDFTSGHPAAKHFNAQDCVNDLKFVPFHPGAIKAYKELGVWKEAHDKRQAKLLADLPAELR